MNRSISNTVSSKLPLDVFGHLVNMSAYQQETVQSYRYIAIMFSEHPQAPEVEMWCNESRVIT